MSKKDREKKRIKENRKKIVFMDRKASFLSAIIVLVTMLNECLGFKYEGNPNLEHLYVAELIVLVILFYVILVTKRMDKIIDTDKAGKLTSLLTMASIIIFLLCLIIKIDANPFLIQLGFILISVEIAAGVLYIIFW